MKEKTAQSIPIFLMRVMVIHTLTYFMIGLLASNILDYRAAFNAPIIRDYMLPFGASSIFMGPFVQPLRGLIIGLVLLPFRSFLGAAKHGWLYLWLFFVGIGIVSTPAAAPSSIEGVIYTKLPLWYHLYGLPEILMQTLLFSILIHLYMRHPMGIVDALPPVFGTMLQSLAGACFAFIGYAMISILFAIVGNADIQSDANMSLKTQGLFLAPFICNFAVIVFSNLKKQSREIKKLTIYCLTWLLNALLLAGYQQVFLEGANIVYVLIAPVLPAWITAVIASKKLTQIQHSVSRNA